MVTSEEGAATQHRPECAAHSKTEKPEVHFELTIILPPAPFHDGQSAPALVLPCSSRELVRELKALVIDSAEGFWVGSFTFQRDGDEAGLRLGDWDEIGLLFEGEDLAETGKQRAIRVVDAPVDEPEARAHVIRFRDALHNVSPALQSRVGFNRKPNDPTGLIVESGSTSYLALRDSTSMPEAPEEPGSPPAAVPLALTNGDDHEEARLEELNSPSSPKKRKTGKSKARSRQASAQVNGVNNVEHSVAEQVSQALVRLPSAGPSQPRPPPRAGPSHVPDVDDPNSHVFVDWTQEDAFVDPFGPITRPRSADEVPILPLVRAFAVSPFSPPPQHLRLRGHYIYLTITTLEGASLHVTVTSQGYYVDRTSQKPFFDGAMRSDKIVHTSLFALLAHESPNFVRNMQTRLHPLPADVPDLYANVAPIACTLNAPWLVHRPKVEPDHLRLQLAYVSSGQLQPEVSPPAHRDWNDEFISVREMPNKAASERLNRDRALARLQAEFSSAAAKAVQMIVRGEITPINPNEPKSSHTFLHHSILFVSAEDPQGQHALLGGDEAVRVTVLKDLHGVRLLNTLDLPGVHSLGTVVVDYQGERWVAQALLPGLLGPTKPEETPEPSSEKKADEAESSGATITEIDAKTETTETTDASVAPAEPKLDSNFKIIYGSNDTEHPELGAIMFDEKCHEIASKVAQHLHLASHAVKDPKSGKPTDLWLPMEAKGVLGTDGRTYLIDLYRLQPVDITWLEKDLDGPLLTLEHPPVALHANGHTNGVNGVNGQSTDSDSESSGPSSPRPHTYPHHFALLRPQLLEKFREDELRRFLQERVSLTRLSGMLPPEGESLMEWHRVAREAQALPNTKSGDDAEDSSKDVMDTVAAAGHSVFEMSSFEVAFNPDAYVERKGGPKLGEFPENEKTTKMVRAASVYLREFLLPDFVSDVAVITPQPHDGAELTKQMHDRGIPMRYLGYIAVACEKAPRGLPERHAPSARTPMAHLKALTLHEMTFRAAKHILRRLIRGRPSHEVAPLVSHFLNCLVGDQVNARPRADLSDVGPALRKSLGEWAHLSVSSLRDQLCHEIASRFRFSMPRSFFDSVDFLRPQLLRDVTSRCGIQLLLRQYTFKQDPSARSDSRMTMFVPDDVINLVPIVHDAPHKATWIDEHFEQGQQHIRMGQIGAGEQLISEALNFAEQVYGTVHPDLARKYHELAVLYHGVATPLMRNANVFEHGHALSSSVDDRARSKKESGLETKEQMLETKREAQAFFEHALRMARQSVVIAERCFGLDHAETLQNYIDLAILEHANDRAQVALFFCKHALELLALMSCKNHTDWSRIMLNAAQIVQNWQNHKVAAPLFRLTHDITAISRGTETYVTATVFSTCAAGLANGGHLKEAVQIQKEAVTIFNARFGDSDERTKEAEGTLEQLIKLATRKEKGDAERIQRLMRRMRIDDVRAREIIARSGQASLKGKEQPPKEEEEVAAAVPNFGHLEIDEIVKMIEGGGEQTKASKRK